MFSLFTTVFAEPAVATATTQTGGFGAMASPLLMLVIMFAVFYFILIRPQKKKEKELKNMLASLKVNDEVATIGGLHGKIVRIKDDLFVLETGIGTTKSYITVDRNAVSRFMKRGAEEKIESIDKTPNDAE